MGNPRIVIRMPAEEIAALKSVAASRGVSLAECCREILMGDAARNDLVDRLTLGTMYPGAKVELPSEDMRWGAQPVARSLGRLPGSPVKRVIVPER